MKKTFKGYQRKNGSVGVRNYVAIIPTVGCANEIARRISVQVSSAVPILHHQGCCQLPTDVRAVTRVLTGLARNPNVAAVLLVSLGCESVKVEEIKGEVEPDKPVKAVSLQKLGGFTNTIAEGIKLAKKMALDLTEERREATLNDLTIGVKCGASDTTSGIASNPATGSAVNKLIERGATVIFGETTEIIGAEHILAERTLNKQVKDDLLTKVEEMERRAKRYGVDMRGGQPTGGNIRGGLTTIEEKSLGAIAKSGTKKIQSVLEYGEIPSSPGLHFMDSPGREMEFLTGVASSGCQVILFSTGLGAPQGFPLSPVIKISGNQRTCRQLNEHIDVDVSKIVREKENIENEGGKIINEVFKVASGKKTKAEFLNYDKSGVNSNIYSKGPVI